MSVSGKSGQDPFESARVDSSKVLLLKPDEVKRWLAERATADLVMVETGEHQTLPSPNEIRIWERLAFAVIAT